MINHISHKYQLHINCLKEEKSREIRLGRLNEVVDLFEKFNYKEEKELQELKDFLNENFLNQLLLTLEDSITQIRTKALYLLNFIIKKAELQFDDDKRYSFIFYSLFSRLNYLNNIFIEPMEDLRLEILNTIENLIKLKNFNFNQYIPEFMTILSRIALDGNPDMKEKLSLFIIFYYEYFSNNKSIITLISQSSKALVISLVKNSSHQRNKIRKISILAITQILIMNNSLFSEAQICYKNGSNDKNHEVRLSVYESLSKLLFAFNITYLRKYEGLIVKYFLSGLSDEKENIKDYCFTEIEKLGEYRKNLSETIEDSTETETENLNELNSLLNSNKQEIDLSLQERMMLSEKNHMNIKDISNKIENLNSLGKNQLNTEENSKTSMEIDYINSKIN